MLQFCLLTMVMRVGEALHPGPILGTINPCGLLGKAASVKELPRDDSGHGTWVAAETHLTLPGLHRFGDELRHVDAPLRVVPGAPAPPVNQSATTIGGKAAGVALLTPHPARALNQDWPAQAWQSGRIQASAVLIQNRWIKVGMLYGLAYQPHTVARNATDQLLEHLVQKIAIESKGCRIICGDWNQEYGVLPQQAVLESLGFVEVQRYALYKWQRAVAPTCKGKTVRDYMWISPELLPWLQGVATSETHFADHAILYGRFRDFDSVPPVAIWRVPKDLQWDDVPDLDSPTCTDAASEMDQNSNVAVSKIMTQMEQRVDHALRQAGKPGLLAIQKDRPSQEVQIS